MFRTILLLSAGLALSACAGSPTKSNWSCRVERGGVCATIDEIDHSLTSSSSSVLRSGGSLEGAPIVDGASPARWWQTVGTTGAANIGSPVRQSDVVIRVLIAPWIDAAGDYHGKSEVHAVMRKGGWWLNAPDAGPAPAPKVAAAAGAGRTAAIPPSSTEVSAAGEQAKPQIVARAAVDASPTHAKP